MIKTKWLEVSLPVDLPALAQKLNGHSFKRGGQSGLELLDLTKDRLAGRFTHEIFETELIRDPFGEEIRLETRRYQVFDFLLVKVDRRRSLLRLDSPPRSVKAFVEKVSEVVGFGFFIAPIQVQVTEFIDHLRRTGETHQLRISRVRARGILLKGRASAKVEIISQMDAYGDLTEVFKKAKFAIEKATATFTRDAHSYSVEVSQSGTISVDEELLDLFTALFVRFSKNSKEQLQEVGKNG